MILWFNTDVFCWIPLFNACVLLMRTNIKYATI